MHVVRAVLRGSRPDEAGVTILAAPGVLLDLIWAHAVPEVALEHVLVRGGGPDTEVILFLVAGSDAEALRRARHLIACTDSALDAHGHRLVLPDV